MARKAKRVRNLFDPDSSESFPLSRSKLENFIRCPHCFYLDRRLGIDRPSTPGFTLNLAVDELLKTEFDTYRTRAVPHPLMKEFGIDAIPYAHDCLDDWRNVRRGVRWRHPDTSFELFGAVDDIWVNPAGELHVVDYKATSTRSEISIDSGWGKSYKRQLEIYGWLLRQNGFHVSDTGYFVYANGIKDRGAFDNRLEFDLQIITHHGNDSWVNGRILEAYRCLCAESPPALSDWCDYCQYRQAANNISGAN